MENVSDYRVGSPFAADPPAVPGDVDARNADLQNGAVPAAVQNRTASGSAAEQAIPAGEPETLGDGVWGQTATAATYASVNLVLFAIVCWALFPVGGAAVAALGALVALMGLSSNRARLATAMLVLHGVLFFACYIRAI